MKLVGLTGGIACGKSTVSAELQRLGIPVVDCDEVTRCVQRKGCWGHRRVVAAFGSSVLQADGELNREALARLVFHNPLARKKLNRATHPAVAAELLRRILAAWLRCEPVLVVDMPLLFESGFYRVTRPNVLVACNFQRQLSRLMSRDGLAHEAAAARVAAQMPLDRKRQLAELALENDGGLDQLNVQVRALAAQLRRGTWLHRMLLSPPGLAAATAAGLLAARLWLKR